MAEFRKAHQFVVFTVNAPAQVAIADYMRLRTHETLADFYQSKRDGFLDAVRRSRLRWHASRGTYFVCASYLHLPEFAGLDEAQFAIKLTREIGVACIPLSAFHARPTERGMVRFCFAKREETLALAAQRLTNL
jgi:methionine aminotransferase